MLRRWRSWATRVIVAAKPQDCAISFWKQYPYFYRRRAPTRGQCNSGRLCERLRKSFSHLTLAHLLSSRGSKEPCRIFSHPNAIPNYQKIGITDSAAKEEERTRKFAFLRQQRAGTIMETQPSTFQSAQNQATFPAGVTIWLGHTPLRQCKI